MKRRRLSSRFVSARALECSDEQSGEVSHRVYLGLAAAWMLIVAIIDGVTAQRLSSFAEVFPGQPIALIYLTTWNVLLSTITHAYGFLTTYSRSRTRNFVFNMIFCSVCLPMTMLVSVVFWSVYAYDINLICPVSMQLQTPWWLNHCLHTSPTVLALSTLFTLRLRVPPQRAGFPLFSMVVFSYLMMILWLGAAHNVWVYRVLRRLDNLARFVSLWACIGISFVFYTTAQKLVDLADCFHRKHARLGRATEVTLQPLE